MSISERQKSKERGYKFYHSERQCPKGHSSLRLTSNGRCYQCSKEQSNEWEKENREWMNEWDRDNPDKRKSYRLKHRYGLSYESYQELLEEQDGKCAICQSRLSGTKRYENLVVDHCHETGKVRGLLCFNCNIGIGKLKDDPVLIKRALSYVTK